METVIVDQKHRGRDQDANDVLLDDATRNGNDSEITTKNMAFGRNQKSNVQNEQESNTIKEEIDKFDLRQDLLIEHQSRDRKVQERPVLSNRPSSAIASPQQQYASESHEDLQKFPDALTIPTSDAVGAAQIQLPSSRASSMHTSSQSHAEHLSSDRLEGQPTMRSQNVVLPEHARKQIEHDSFWNIVRRVWGVKRQFRKKRRETERTQNRSKPVCLELDVYRLFLDGMALEFPNIATNMTRHEWSSTVVYYDCFSCSRYTSKPQELWKGDRFGPTLKVFKETLMTVDENCTRRVILVEDLSPSLIDLFGATFQIPPHVFEAHLDRSGYSKAPENLGGVASWHSQAPAQGYSTITWHRPVLPLLPLTPEFRAKLIGDQAPSGPCISHKCQKEHDVHFRSTSNIWRPNIELCSRPGVYHKGSESEYPVGWEEKATLWSRNIGSCHFGTFQTSSVTNCFMLIPPVVLLLDPLPVLAIDNHTESMQRHLPKKQQQYHSQHPRHAADVEDPNPQMNLDPGPSEHKQLAASHFSQPLGPSRIGDARVEIVEPRCRTDYDDVRGLATYSAPNVFAPEVVHNSTRDATGTLPCKLVCSPSFENNLL